MKHIIMVNPVSGRKKGYSNALIAQKLLKKNGIEAEIFCSEYAGHLREIAHKNAKKAKTRFYSIGGDGTLNEIVSGIVNTSSEVVVLPCGTGNDFSRHSNAYQSLRKIILTSITTESSKFDVIKLNNDRYCINILNAGFDALVAANLKHFRGVPFISGTAKYNLSIVYTLFTNRNYHLKIKTDAFEEKSKYTLVAISNGRYYGGGVIPSPEARADDGKLSICKVNATNLITKLILLPKYKNCEHLNLRPVYMNNDIHTISIVSNKLFPVSIDGEVIFTNRIKGEIQPAAVNIVKIEKVKK